MFIHRTLMKEQCANNTCKDIINMKTSMKKYFVAGFVFGVIIYFIFRYLVEISYVSSLFFSIVSFVIAMMLLYLINERRKKK